MDSVKSFNRYGKVDELEQQAFRRQTRRRILLLLLGLSGLILIIAGAVAGTLIHRRTSKGHGPAADIPPPELTPSTSLRTVCSVTQYPDSCFSSISTYDTANTTDPKQLFKLSLQAAAREVARFADYVNQTAERGRSDARFTAAMEVCSAVVDDAASRFNDSVSVIDDGKKKLLTESTIDDVRTWLSTAVTDLETCLDSLREMNSTEIDGFTTEMENSTEFASNSLAIVTKILALISIPNAPIIHRKLIDGSESDFPRWVGPAERRLLAAEGPTPNVTVAADGTGDCLTIGEAVEKVPKKSEARFVVYVKEGTYNETVVVEKSKWNVMMYGDGKEKTIVTGKLNFVDGTPTFKTATFAAVGKGFIARDIGFKNTAGPEKHQAVAFRSGSDMSVLYRCSFDAYQDTLYAHSNRQFYRECDITGTVDFIFGNSAVVFQGCSIIPRQPLENQFNAITAQGKKDPNQNTGISIHKCTISAAADLTAPTYLGRPWKDYSTTVIMQSSIGSFLNPQGWIEWVRGVDPPNTIFYGEYQNNGDGSSTTQRVAWTGYKAALTSSEAGKFTVASFIQGTEWLQETSVTFDSSL